MLLRALLVLGVACVLVAGTAAEEDPLDDLQLAGLERMMGMSDLEMDLGSRLTVDTSVDMGDMGDSDDDDDDDSIAGLVAEQSQRTLDATNAESERDRTQALDLARRTRQTLHHSDSTVKKAAQKSVLSMDTGLASATTATKSTARNAGRRVVGDVAAGVGGVESTTRRDEAEDDHKVNEDRRAERRDAARDVSAFAALHTDDTQQSLHALLRRDSSKDEARMQHAVNADRRHQNRDMWDDLENSVGSDEKSEMGTIRRDQTADDQAREDSETKASTRQQYGAQAQDADADSLINSIRRAANLGGREQRFLQREDKTIAKDNTMQQQRRTLKDDEAKVADKEANHAAIAAQVKALGRQAARDNKKVLSQQTKDEKKMKTEVRGHPNTKAITSGVQKAVKLERRDKQSKAEAKRMHAAEAAARRGARKVRKLERKESRQDKKVVSRDAARSSTAHTGRNIADTLRRTARTMHKDATRDVSQTQSTLRNEAGRAQMKKDTKAITRNEKRVQKIVQKANNADVAQVRQGETRAKRTQQVIDRNIDSKDSVKGGEDELQDQIGDYDTNMEQEAQEENDLTRETQQQASLDV